MTDFATVKMLARLPVGSTVADRDGDHWRKAARGRFHLLTVAGEEADMAIDPGQLAFHAGPFTVVLSDDEPTVEPFSPVIAPARVDVSPQQFAVIRDHVVARGLYHPQFSPDRVVREVLAACAAAGIDIHLEDQPQ